MKWLIQIGCGAVMFLVAYMGAYLTANYLMHLIKGY